MENLSPFPLSLTLSHQGREDCNKLKHRKLRKLSIPKFVEPVETNPEVTSASPLTPNPSTSSGTSPLSLSKDAATGGELSGMYFSKKRESKTVVK